MRPSQGSTPEWLATRRAGPLAGRLSTPEASTRHHIAYRNSSSGITVPVNFGS